MKKFLLSLVLLFGLTFVSCTTQKVNTSNLSSNEPLSHSKTVCERVKPNSDLINTYWVLIRLNDEPIKASKITKREPHIVLRTDEKLKGHTGCNTIRGHYTTKDNSLSFSDKNFVMTRMFCKESIENKFITVLKTIDSYKIRGEYLEVFDKNSNRLARFKAVYLY